MKVLVKYKSVTGDLQGMGYSALVRSIGRHICVEFLGDGEVVERHYIGGR